MRVARSIPYGVLVCLGIACGPPPELVAERDSLKAEVAKLSSANATLEGEVESGRAKIRVLERDLKQSRQDLALARIGVVPGVSLKARFDTSKGAIECDLLPDAAPMTVANFVSLAEGTHPWTDPVTNQETRRPLYNGTLFHRVIPKFMIQGGDPLGTGRGGPGYRFEDEVGSGLKFDEPGLLAMANAGPNTNGSQFFITDRSTPHSLDGKHTIFGKCQNLDVVEAIASVPTGAADRPAQDVVLRSVTILRTR